MARFVLKRKSAFHGNVGDVPELPGVRIIDNTHGKALLVEADKETLEHYRSELQGWTVWPETTYPRPTFPADTLRRR